MLFVGTEIGGILDLRVEVADGAGGHSDTVLAVHGHDGAEGAASDRSMIVAAGGVAAAGDDGDVVLLLGDGSDEVAGFVDVEA